jgi:hypothetical protein
MYCAASKTVRSFFSFFAMAFLIYFTVSVRPAVAQDPTTQAAQQATRQAQQDMQTAQQAAQQAAQAAQAAAVNNTGGYSSSGAQQPPPTVPSLNTPVPPQIRAAHRIFLANDGSAPNFPIDPNVAYEGFYNALRTWGHYEFADSAQSADLVFQLRGVAPITDVSGGHGGVYSSTTPAFQLTIRDPKTNTRLWTVTSPVFSTGGKTKRDYWQNVDITNLVSRLKVLAGQPLSATETASLTTYPKNHNARTALILTGVLVGVAAGGAVALHAAFEHSLSDMKASQDAFCQANNIPLSECAGG